MNKSAVWKWVGEICFFTILINVLAWAALGIVAFIGWSAQMDADKLQVLATFVIRLNLTLVPIVVFMVIEWRLHHRRISNLEEQRRPRE